MPRIGLVLGAGGAVGHAFHTGVLAALEDATGWDARDAEVIVGTSAGSVVGALLRAGVSSSDLAARAVGAPLSEEGRRLVARADAARGQQPPIPSRPGRGGEGAGGRRTMSAPGAFARAALRPWNARPAALMAAALPEGRIPTELVASGLRPLFDGWPDDALWINAVQLNSGQRVTFGRDARRVTEVASAVAASCAIPAFFAPVTIDGVRYVDGGVHSPTNADLVGGLDLDLVVVSSPMSVAGNALRIAPDQPVRRFARFTLGREIAQVRRRGTPVLTLQPTAADIAVMGLNAMDSSRNPHVVRQVRASTLRRFERADVRDRLALLTTAGSIRRA